MDAKTAISEIEEMLRMMGWDRRTLVSLNSPYEDVRTKRSYMMQFDARMDALQFAIDAIKTLEEKKEEFRRPTIPEWKSERILEKGSICKKY